MANLQELIPAFFTGPNGQRLTPDQIAQRQQVAQSLLGRATDTRPDAGGWASVLNKALMGGMAGYDMRESDKAITANADASQQSIAAMLGSLNGGGAYPQAVAGGASPTSGTATGTIPTNFNIGENQDAIRNGIIETAQAIGADPLDLATAISYETGGTFNPTKAGPTTQWGQHRGLIQFGEPQARQHGVDWNDPIGSQLGANGAVANYFRSSGFKPGMSGLDLYSTINAGSPGRYNASDANNGGAPGSVADKWNNQMAGHRQKALAILGGADGNSPLQNMPYSPQGASGLPIVNAPYRPPSVMPSAAVAATPMAAINQIAPVVDSEGLFAPGADVSEADLAFARQASGPEVQPTQSSNFNDRWNAGTVAPVQDVVAPVAQEVAPQTPAVDPAQSNLLAQNDMMLGGALSPTGTSPVAQALSGYFPDAPSMQSSPQLTQHAGGINPAVIQALSDPYASPQQRQVASLLLGQQMEQAQAAQQQQQLMQQRQATAQTLGINPALAGDPDAWKAAIDQATRNRNTATVGGSLIDANTGQPIYQAPQERFTTISGPQAQQLGLDPNKAYNVGPDGKITPIAESGVTVNVGGGEKFGEKLAELDAKAIGDIDVAGRQATRNINRINQLDELLKASPSGIDAAWRQRAGEWGIKTDGLDALQAAQAAINSLVPEQRQPGSGPMSDADLELFKQSLPRTINQPGGNELIIATMRGIAEYDAEGSRIIQRLRAGQLNREQAFEELNKRSNPIEDFKRIMAGNKNTSSDGWKDAGNGVRIRPKGSN